MLDGLLPLTDPGAVFAVLFLLVLLGPLTARRLRLPPLAGLIIAGMLVGPNSLDVLGRDTFVTTLGYVGLLFLMFQGGLDLDVDGFRRRRGDAVVFGVLTFLVPMALTVATSRWLGIAPLGAAMIGAALTSHTLLSYPTVQRFGLTRDRAVTGTLGATLVANTGALVVLAFAADAARGNGWAMRVAFTVGLVVYGAVVLVLVPRLTRWFFTGLGQDREVRLTYLLSGMGVAALVARLIGIEPIVGAFLVGLAFNRFVPAGTVIAERIAVLGQSLFIPAFLISTGMLLDPVALLTDPRTLLLGGVFLAATVASKWVAAEAAGRLLRIGRQERRLMFSLSVGQAAGALAATVVAQDLGLLGAAEVNAIVLVILGSALVAGSVAESAAPRIARPERGGGPLGSRVVVPVSNPATVGPLVRVAAQVAAQDSGAVVAVAVLGAEAPPEHVRGARDLTTAAERVALAAGAEVTGTVRMDASTADGVLHTALEQEATCLVMGWKGHANAREGLFGSVIDQVVSSSPVPVLVCRPGQDIPTQRVIVVAMRDSLEAAALAGTALAFDVADRIVRFTEAGLVVVSDVPADDLRPRLRRFRIRASEVPIVTVATVIGGLGAVLEPGDLVLTGVRPASGGLDPAAARLARAAEGHTVVVAVPR
jgi:Kef-type K+ transport system membrane component KefB/nucleotide-binding universal stress UspA family protein